MVNLRATSQFLVSLVRQVAHTLLSENTAEKKGDCSTRLEAIRILYFRSGYRNNFRFALGIQFIICVFFLTRNMPTILFTELWKV